MTSFGKGPKCLQLPHTIAYSVTVTQQWKFGYCPTSCLGQYRNLKQRHWSVERDAGRERGPKARAMAWGSESDAAK
jgi:hypothetical protein